MTSRYCQASASLPAWRRPWQHFWGNLPSRTEWAAHSGWRTAHPTPGPLGGIMSGGDERTKERPALETERLMLRRPDARDVGPIMAIVGDWEVVRRLARVPHPYHETDAHFFLNTVHGPSSVIGPSTENRPASKSVTIRKKGSVGWGSASHNPTPGGADHQPLTRFASVLPRAPLSRPISADDVRMPSRVPRDCPSMSY